MRMGKLKYLLLFSLIAMLALSCTRDKDSAAQSGTSGESANLPLCDVTEFVPNIPAGDVTEVMVPMSDCVRLATDVYLPEDGGPHPTLLIRLPYNKKTGMGDFSLMEIIANIFTGEGFAVVIQDTRGRYASEGEWVPLLPEQADGMDTIAWVEVQPWFDGNLGMFGGSYFGYTELAVAWQKPASLKTIVPLITTGDTYYWFYHSGLPRPDTMVAWPLTNIADNDPELDISVDQALEQALIWPFDEADDRILYDLYWYNAWTEHTFNDDYYTAYMPADYLDSIDIPMLMLSGWFDIFANRQLVNFVQAQEKEVNPGDVRIIVGPWTHSMGFGEIHDYTFPDPRNILSFVDHLIDWYKHHLTGTPLQMNWGPVLIYNAGAGTWHDRQKLWPTATDELILYLDGDSNAATCNPTGSLADAAPSLTNTIEYTYDPLDPIINSGGPLLGYDAGCLIESDHCDRDDVINFESEPFAAEFTIDGAITLELTVASSAPDTAFIARLALIDTDGIAYFINQAIMTLSHRDGDDVRATYTPGDQVTLNMKMLPLLWTIKQGQALRLQISSSSFPTVAQHPNVDENWFSEDSPQSAEQQLIIGRGIPGRLIIETDR
jgi:uncharacterized protein